MAQYEREASGSLAAAGDFSAPAGFDACVGFCDRLPSRGGDSDGSLLYGGDDAEAEFAGYSGGELYSDAAAGSADPSLCAIGWMAFCNGAATWRDSDARFADANALDLRQHRRTGAGSVAGDCRTGGGFDDAGADSGIAAGSGTGGSPGLSGAPVNCFVLCKMKI